MEMLSLDTNEDSMDMDTICALRESRNPPVPCVTIDEDGAEFCNPDVPIVDPLFGATDIKIEPGSQDVENTQPAENLVRSVYNTDSTDQDGEDDDDDDDYYGTESDNDDSDWEKPKKTVKKKTAKKKTKKALKPTKKNPPKIQTIPRKTNKASTNEKDLDNERFLSKFFPEIAEKLCPLTVKDTQLYPKIVDYKKFTGRNVACFVCGNRFHDSNDLKIHLQNHPQRKLRVCSSCGSVGFNKCLKC